ncbi:spherulation-specific family 4 protein [Streptomyces sp. ISL-10]|uniref:spherulation-specific family 4 protein n=1 Tax=Streptomyces sp. ISL-10 TaxID=2819172 RepID=UPI001BEC2112|nr:spherulation-specific family 4 protein [Streptomyces sp. ISL-10]MBT2366465.1 spherulation-specific family 4 protein [Streptomyces sp. ISL-10]
MSGLLVPYYEHPVERPAAWDAVIAAAPRLYGVVINPASGPGTAPDPAFAAVADRLREAGVRVVGYVDTDYGRRPHAAVLGDLLAHRDWYAADGVFFDQVSSGPDTLPHYGRLTVTARAAGATTVVLNHGVHPHPTYTELADVLVTFEGPWDAYRTAGVPSWTAAHPPERFCHLVYAAPPDAQAGAAIHCVVPGTGAHPWGTLPHALTTAPR